jgi:hypothetical protein
MALFSELDWVLLVGVGAVLLFGQGSGTALRQLGRWYGRAMRLKQELLAEFTRAADLPTPTGGQPYSIRQALFETDPAGGRVTGVPAAVVTAPALAVATAAVPVAAYGTLGPETWSMARPAPGMEARP